MRWHVVNVSEAFAAAVGEDDEEGERDEAAYARKLHAFLAPRMLRRLKHNVASLSKELPPKVQRCSTVHSPVCRLAGGTRAVTFSTSRNVWTTAACIAG